jgi:diaminopimelate decarboxylase
MVEATTEFELRLALDAGLPPARIVDGGVHKTGRLVESAAKLEVMGVVVDSLRELARLAVLSEPLGGPLPVFLRVKTARTPRRADRGGVTSARSEGFRGMDVASGELVEALDRIRSSPALRYVGPCCCVGVDLRDSATPRRFIDLVARTLALARERKLETTHVYFGGGFATSTSREMSIGELLLYQGGYRLPSSRPETEALPELARALVALLPQSRSRPPHLLVEAGRYVTGPAQMLLVTAQGVKRRRGIPPWIITDGGAGTVAFPLYYEIHEVVNCSRADSRPLGPVTMVGPVCYSTDWIYRNKVMPPIEPGDVIAVLDTGAYFSVTERGFGFLRPAAVGVSNGGVHVLRRRETPEDVVRRDVAMPPS